MGTLATVLASKKIPTRTDLYRAEVEGDIENMEGVLKITQIRVHYFLNVSRGKAEEARQTMDEYLHRCPAAQSVIGCIDIQHRITIQEVAELT